MMPVGALLNQPGAVVGVETRPAAPKKEPTEAFRFTVARHDKVLEYQFSIARWIMASLLVLNGGAMLALLNVADKTPKAAAAGSWFLWGAAAAVLSGSIAWLNCNLITIAADFRLDWQKLDTTESATADKLETWSWVAGIAAVILSVASLALFFAGAAAVKNALVASAVAALLS